MAQLILIKHSSPIIDPNKPAKTWVLSEEGRTRSEHLALVLRPYQPQIMVSSDEPKAIETGAIAARALGINAEVFPDLQEHDRSQIGWIDDPTVFRQRVKNFFEEPSKLVFGGETADQASARFIAAVQRVLVRFPGRTVAITTHGTVITLFAAHKCGIAPYPLWTSLKLPAVMVFTLPTFALQTVIEDAGQ